MKNELGVKIMTEFATFIPKPFSYLTDDNDENQKAKGTKKYVIKLKLIFKEINKINCLENIRLAVDCIRKNHKELVKNSRLS